MARLTGRSVTGVEEAKRVGWTVWILAAGFYAYGFAQRVAPSVMVDDLMNDFGASARSVGTVSASFLYAYAILQLPLGILLDRFGTRRIFLAAALSCTAGALMFATAQTIMMAHFGRGLLGAGAGVAWVGTLKLAAQWFDVNRFALLSGATLTFGMVGAVIGQGPLAALVGVIGWRGSMFVGAGVAVLFFLLLLRLPDEAGVSTADDEDLPERPLLSGVRQILSHQQTWFAAVYGAFMTVPMLGFATLWGVPYLMERFDISRPIAGLGTSLLLVGWGIGAPTFGYLSGRTGHRRKLMIAGASINLATFLVVLYLPGVPFLAIAALLFLNGLGSGSMPLCFALARGHQPPHLAASTFGFVNGLVILLAAIVQPLIGLIMDLTWDGAMRGTSRFYDLANYQIGLTVIPGAVLVALVLSMLLYEPQEFYAINKA